MKRNSKALLLLAIIMVITFTLQGCIKENKEDIAVAIIDGEIISEAEYDELVAMFKKVYELQYGISDWEEEYEEGKTYEQLVTESVYESMITDRLLLMKADEMGITVTDEEVQQEIDTYFTEEGSYEDYLAMLEITDEKFRQITKKDKTISKFIEQYVAEIDTSDEILKAYYEENPNILKSVEASHILVDTEAEANVVLERLNQGEDFAELATELSKDTGSAAYGGELGYFGVGNMVPEFEEAAFNLEIGEISEPVKSQYGYHIIKVTDIVVDDFEESIEAVKSSYQNVKYTEMIEGLEDEVVVERKLNFEKE